MTIAETVNLTLERLRQNRPQEAIGPLQLLIQQHPEHPDGWQLLAMALHQLGRTAEAIPLLERAVAISRDPNFLSNLGEMRRTMGHLAAAVEACRAAVMLAPNMAVAHQNLALALAESTELTEAAAAARRAVALTPDSAMARRILGHVLSALGNVDQAIPELEASLRLAPTDFIAWGCLGSCQEARRRMERALFCFRRAVELAPSSSQALYHLGRMLLHFKQTTESQQVFDRLMKMTAPTDPLRLGAARCLERADRFDEAIAICKPILAANPKEPMAYCVVANALFQSCRLKEGEAFLRQGLQCVETGEMRQNLAINLMRQGRGEEALEEIDRAINLNPKQPVISFSKSLILLYLGRMAEAWPWFETRWRHPAMDAWRPRRPKPLWDGSPLNGRQILLFSEQGMGDTIMYARYATLVAQRGGVVSVEVQCGLREVIASIKGVSRAVERGEDAGEYDVMCPLLSLPGVFRTTLDTIPRDVPYIQIARAAVQRWSEFVPRRPGFLNVGLVWAGGEILRENHLRSTTLASLAPLASVPGVVFYSLQKGDPARQAAQPPAGLSIVNLDDRIQTFADTGAAMMNLDLVISVDTSVIHLAGAMGRPVWALLSRNTTHTWMLERTDSPWYPTMRLIRQPTLGDWPTTIEIVRRELERWAADRLRAKANRD